MHFDVTSTFGQAAVAGDRLLLLASGVQVASKQLSSADIAAGMVEIAPERPLLEGVHVFSAKLVDQAGNIGQEAMAGAALLIDLPSLIAVPDAARSEIEAAA